MSATSPVPDEVDPGETDAALIEQSVGDPERFAVLFDRHGAAVARYARHWFGPDDAADIVADTFLTAFRKRGHYRASHDNALPWLLGVASRTIRDRWRSARREYRALERLLGRYRAESIPNVDERLVALTQEPRLAAALAAMPVKNREVLLLIAWADLSYDEVAEALCIPVGTVRSRLSRARQHLRNSFDNTDPRTISEGLGRG